MDPDYEVSRARLDEQNIETGSELENEDYEDHVDGIFNSLFKKKKQVKTIVPVSTSQTLKDRDIEWIGKRWAPSYFYCSEL